jgi:RNA polymerase sigma-70 factor, ECF subfamily
MTEIDDITIRQASKGDREAFKRLYDHYAPFVWKVAFRSANGQNHTAEEIVQETFIRVLSGLKRFGGNSALSTWIYRVAYNAAMTLVMKTPRGRFVDIEEIPVAADAAAGGRYENQDLIRHILKNVSAEDRFLLTGHAVEGISFEELESITGINAGSLRVRLHRLRTGLQQKFGDLMEGASL